MVSILGISAFYHDSAAALIIDGEIIAAAQEERFTRKKHDAAFPSNAIDYCLSEAGINLSKVDYVAFYDKPFLKFERLLETYVAYTPRGFSSFAKSMPLWLGEKLFLKTTLTRQLQEKDPNFNEQKLLFGEHHLSHAASAFYASPFENAIVLTLDGVGEWATTTVAIGDGNKLDIVKEIHFPHSLGLLYSAFTYYIGFRVNSGEYKVMGLAPYGEPKYKNLIMKYLIDLKSDGSFRLDQSYFNYASGLTMVNQKFISLFGEPVRNPDIDKLSQFHMDIAASIQAVTEDIVLSITRSLSNEYDIPNLCLAGGVALNCVANGKIVKDASYKKIWIQPASGDAGGALGCAMMVWYKHLGNTRKTKDFDSMKGSYLGPSYEQKEIEKELINCKAKFQSVNEKSMIEIAAQALANGKAIGWFQGRMEFGPRALGNRSILGDPSSETMQKVLNLKVKFRESFRPFAPSVLREDVSDWFELNHDSPYMLITADVKENKRIEMSEVEKSLFGIDKLNIKRSNIPAVTHIDYSARIQTVHRSTNPLYYSLIKKFKEKTKFPILVNTSFNVRGEPIVCTVEDAFRCFMGNGLDMLIVGNCVVNKDEQKTTMVENYKNKYKLD